ncbi:MAG: hypothetical protein R3B52_01135 [Candidatus Paceibacterota bacterium]
MRQTAFITSSVILIVFLASLQSIALIRIGAAQANLLLSFGVMLSIYVYSQRAYASLALFIAMLLSQTVWISRELLVAGGILFVVRAIQKTIAADRVVATVTLTTLATLLWYLTLAPRMVFSSLFIIELILNIAISLLVLLSLTVLNVEANP